MATLGIDFGTSNTAAAAMINGAPVSLPLEPGAETIPTAIFLDFATGETLYGAAAAQAMMEGQDGRFMRALKSILGTPLARERRQFLNEKLTLIDIIARFLAEIRTRAETAAGHSFDRVISGRPVRFHSTSEARNTQAQADLAEAYARAGFSDVQFLPEPEAAALAAGGTGRCLIVDIGGGTSDFTLCDRSDTGTQVLASQGIRLGGTDFDKTLSLAHVMAHLGYGAQIGRAFGEQTDTAPRAVFQDLASWEKIAFVYAPALLRDVRGWQRLAREPVLFERLASALEMHLGHDVAYAVEAGKIQTNSGDTGLIDLTMVEPGLQAGLPRAALDADLAPAAAEIAACARETVAQAGVDPDTVERVIYVGGSSLLEVVRNRVEAVFPRAAPETSEVFTAVVHGLARAGQRD